MINSSVRDCTDNIIMRYVKMKKDKEPLNSNDLNDLLDLVLITTFVVGMYILVCR